MPSFEYTFPAVRATQAGQEFFVTMCPGGMLSALVGDDISRLRRDIEAQWIVNEHRVPEIMRYSLGHRGSYIFSAITAAVDSPVRFDTLGDANAPAASGISLFQCPPISSSWTNSMMCGTAKGNQSRSETCR